MNSQKSSKGSKIKVAIRKRPLSKKEKSRNENDIIDVVNSAIVVSETKFFLKNSWCLNVFHRQKVDLTKYIE